MIERALLVVNRSAATGHSPAEAARLKDAVADQLGWVSLRLEVAEGHPAIAAATRQFLEESSTPALVIAGGGGGTLRAVIEGVCEGWPQGELPGADQVQVAALRMGSGNVVAKAFGVPLDSEAGLKGILTNLRANRTAPCCVMRVEVGQRDREPEIRFGATMAGFGQFGLVPGDLLRWRDRHPGLRKLEARCFEMERVNGAEYITATGLRFSQAVLRPEKLGKIEIRLGDRVETLTVLLGVVLNFRLVELPFDPGVGVEDEALSLHFLPYRGRLASFALLVAPRQWPRSALVMRIEKGERVQIRLVGRDSAEFFLDEDPLTFYSKVEIEPAGTLAFVPGPLYDKQIRPGL